LQACEREVDRNQGPKAPRHYQFVATGPPKRCRRSVRATPACRPRASRVTEPGASATPQGPARSASPPTASPSSTGWSCSHPSSLHRTEPASWPAHGALLFDHIRFRIGAEGASGRGIPRGTVAFDVFCPGGYRADKPRLWRAGALLDRPSRHLERFSASLEGGPPRVVCDAHRGMIRPIDARWRQVDFISANAFAARAATTAPQRSPEELQS